MMKELKRPIAFFSAFAMFMTILLYFPVGTFRTLDLGIKVSAEGITLTQPTEGDGSADSPYKIGTVAELYWFADKVNNDNTNFGNANAVLTADITVNENLLSLLKYDDKGNVTNGTSFKNWTSIGNEDNKYTGTFDGDNHKISGLYFNDENADMPKGWLLWHSYTSYSEKDSHLYLQNPNGNISEISGDFIHAMNGDFGNNPDKIVFMAIDEKADEWDIFLYDNEKITNLTQNSGYRNEDPKWSPDGTSIVFKRGYWNSDINDFTYNLAVLDVNSMEVTMLTNDLYEEAMPCFSVDGKHIYYTKYNEGYGSIVCMDIDNGEIKTIFQEENINAYYPMINDKYLYFTKWHSSENHHDEIMVYDGNTAESMIFNSEIYDCSDACPVDENSMIYSSKKNGNYSLYYFNGTESIEIPGINTDKNELGANFYLFSEETIKNNVSGDINADGVFNVSDIVSMKRWLLDVPGAEPVALETCDLTDDDLLNVFDLIAMKRKLIKSADSVFI